MHNVFEELKRRNVFRVTAAYAVIAWVLIQVGDLLFATLELGPEPAKILLAILMLGFVPVVLFTWAFEITPEGIKKEEDVDRDESVTHVTARKLDMITIGLLIVAIIIFAADKMGTDEPAMPTAQTNAAKSSVARPAADPAYDMPPGQAVSEQSIAVLPFEAYSADQDDRYFGKGIAEEILNALAKFPELKVAARTSAFSFAETNADIRHIAEQLDVAHVLEGSVRRSENRIRITAQLIRASDGFHLWSDAFDRELTDVFAIQDEIVAELSRVLQFRLGVGAGAGRASYAKTTVRAYEIYLKGLDMWWRRGTSNNREDAISMFARVTRLDPNFADGWAAYGTALAMTTSFIGHLPPDDHFQTAENALSRALKLEPDNVRALAGMSQLYSTTLANLSETGLALERALKVAPNDTIVQYAAAAFYHRIGNDAAASHAMRAALALDPLNLAKQRMDVIGLALRGTFDADHSYVLSTFGNIDACSADAMCNESHRIAAVVVWTSAIHAGTAADVARARALIDATPKIRPPYGNEICYFDAAHTVFESGELSPEISTCVTGADKVQAGSVNDMFMISVLAKMGHDDLALKLLFSPALLREWAGYTENLLVLSPGRFEMPETIRRHPHYHDWWSRPGMPELAAARRANGATAGLPLPVQAAVVE
ncbi:MAG: hypothetical protein KJO31_02620 [Gammaproteobacteria bacterium]|nr:hypothetical protein [Gammaproteobacteria bacterium]